MGVVVGPARPALCPCIPGVRLVVLAMARRCHPAPGAGTDHAFARVIGWVARRRSTRASPRCRDGGRGRAGCGVPPEGRSGEPPRPAGRRVGEPCRRRPTPASRRTHRGAVPGPPRPRRRAVRPRSSDRGAGPGSTSTGGRRGAIWRSGRGGRRGRSAGGRRAWSPVAPAVDHLQQPEIRQPQLGMEGGIEEQRDDGADRPAKAVLGLGTAGRLPRELEAVRGWLTGITSPP
jgi:hypothetical protein